jgi:hypothetical protein
MKYKKILVIGFQKYDANMYPHLKSFLDSLSNYCEMKYFFFRERGEYFQSLYTMPWRLGTYKTIFIRVLRSIIDMMKLMQINEKYDAIIAIDAYIYVITAKLRNKEKLILWSHDFVGVDHSTYNTFFTRHIYSNCVRSIIKNKKIIIQDPKRLKALLESLQIPEFIPDVYYMPVFLENLSLIFKAKLSSLTRPRILQCGGIGKYRSSDKLLSHYQTHSNNYRLLFHGFIFEEIITEAERSPKKPMISSKIIDSKHLYQIIDFCDIGFVSYEVDDINHRYLSRASGQMVEFLRMGKPVIVMSKSDLNEFVETSGIGVGINDINELDHAIAVIKADYDTYSSNCIQCFNKFFNVNLYIPKILDWI